MGQKSKKGEISISKCGNSIRLRWRVKGVRYSFNPPFLGHNPDDLEKAKILAATIKLDISKGCFDPTLEKYKGKGNKIEENTKEDINSSFRIDSKVLICWFDKWVKDYIKASPNDGYIYGLRSMFVRWGDFVLEDCVELYNREKIGSTVYNRRLGIINKFFSFVIKRGILPYNPFEDIGGIKSKNGVRSQRLPLSTTEINRFLKAIKTNEFCSPFSNYPHSHYYPFLYFIFKTGVRNGEAIGLRVKHIDFKKKYVHICESLARTINCTNDAARTRKTTKNTKERYIPLTKELLNILRKQVKDKRPDDLVFTSFTGKCIDDRMLQRRVFKPVIKKLGFGDKDLYVARHSFSTRAIEQKFSPSEVSQLTGNNTETLLRRYVHLFNLPKKLPK